MSYLSIVSKLATIVGTFTGIYQLNQFNLNLRENNIVNDKILSVSKQQLSELRYTNHQKIKHS